MCGEVVMCMSIFGDLQCPGYTGGVILISNNINLEFSLFAWELFRFHPQITYAPKPINVPPNLPETHLCV